MVLSTAALIGSALLAAGGAGMSAYKRNQAQEEEAQSYKRFKEFLDSQYYLDPLSTIGNQAIIKQATKNHELDLEAIENQATAGGATMENKLAARQAKNESLDKMYTSLLMNEDARRNNINQQKLRLDQQHSQNIQNGFYQAAQDWQQWGAAGAQAALSLGSTGLLGGGSNSIADTAAAQHSAWTVPGSGSAAQDTSGLMGVYRNWDGQMIKKG